MDLIGVGVRVSGGRQVFYLSIWLDWFNLLNWFGFSQPVQPMKPIELIYRFQKL